MKGYTVDTEGMTTAEADETFFEEDEPLDVILAILARPVDATTALPLNAEAVAAAILNQTGPIDAWKLQKLLYYVQAEHLTKFGVPLFPERIEAWAHGPVVRDVYRQHRGRYDVHQIPGADLTLARKHPTAMTAISIAIAKFGQWSGPQLRELSHREQPWRDARGNLAANESGTTEITVEAMAAYYESLAQVSESDDEPDLLSTEPLV